MRNFFRKWALFAISTMTIGGPFMVFIVIAVPVLSFALMTTSIINMDWIQACIDIVLISILIILILNIGNSIVNVFIENLKEMNPEYSESIQKLKDIERDSIALQINIKLLIRKIKKLKKTKMVWWVLRIILPMLANIVNIGYKNAHLELKFDVINTGS